MKEEEEEDTRSKPMTTMNVMHTRISNCGVALSAFLSTRRFLTKITHGIVVLNIRICQQVMQSAAGLHLAVLIMSPAEQLS